MNILVFLAVVFTLVAARGGTQFADRTQFLQWLAVVVAAATFWALVIG